MLPIAITVSTNYIDLLPIAYEVNHSYFDEWIFVTAENDIDTLNFLRNKNNVTVLIWDFKKNGADFDKGGALRFAQNYAYERYQNHWYLILDSDICLSSGFFHTLSNLEKLDPDVLYGSFFRHEYQKTSDFLGQTNYHLYDRMGFPDGFFQLYKKKEFYAPSNDAAVCDVVFANTFKEKKLFTNFISNHLGWQGSLRNHKGRVIGVDFLADIAYSECAKCVPHENYMGDIEGHIVGEHVKLSRNTACICGSGAKYKNCHGVLS